MHSIVYRAAPPLPPEAVSVVTARLGRAAATRVQREIAACPAHRITPLRRLSDLARAWGLREIWVKDERARLRLGSFKAVGGAYAVLRLGAQIAARGAARRIPIEEMLRVRTRALAEVTFAAATSGNHGCSVAAGARLVGSRCVIFVKDGVPAAQLRAIARQGAQIIPISGTYDDAVAACRRACADRGWICVPDCSADPNDATVALVMEGYTLIASEILDALPAPPSHAVLQAGVGGFAAALAGHFAAVHGERAPRIIVAEPDAAACLQASARAGRPVSVPRGSTTSMARLDCYTPSAAAWPILRALTAAFVSLDDAHAEAACAVLADHDLHTTPSGAAGLAALERVAATPRDRQRLGLGADSEVLVVVTEAATTTP